MKRFIRAVGGVAGAILAVCWAQHHQETTQYPVPGHDWAVPALGMAFVYVDSLKMWVGRYEVTNEEYASFIPDHASGKLSETIRLDGKRQPAVMVSWDDASEYCAWLTAREAKAGRLPVGLVYRLPLESEWLQYARCGTKRKYPWGDGWPPNYGNYGDRTCADHLGDPRKKAFLDYDDKIPATCDVERSGKNDWGLMGVGGNVSEWVLDQSPGTPSRWRQMRGGSYLPFGRECLECDWAHAAHDRSGRVPDVGFRIVLGPALEQVKPPSSGR